MRRLCEFIVHVKLVEAVLLFIACYVYPLESRDVFFLYDEDIKLHRITLSGFLSKYPQAKVHTKNIERLLADCEVDRPIVVVLGDQLLNLAKRLCRSQPIVFAHVHAPQLTNYRENKNITGIAFELSMRYFLQDLRRLIPEGSKIGFIYSSELNHYLTTEMDFLEAEFELMGVRRRVQSRENLGEVVKELIENEKIKALWVMPDPLYNKAIFRKLADICMQKKVLLVTTFESLVKEVDAAFALAASYFDVGVQLAEIVDKIERGTDPQEIPLSQPKKYGTYLNPQVFQKLGIAVPLDLMNREKVTQLVNEGQDLVNAGKADQALDKFREALRLDRKNSVANYYVNLLEAQENYRQALALLSSGNEIKAVPYLVSAASILPEARLKLNQLRQELRSYSEKLYKEGIAAFHEKKYQVCIQNMNLVLMIEPNHKDAELYKEKAEKRAKAVEAIR
ncbi:MAG: hypothetical protein NZM25_00640 [Leptospiraceae bacterium]|nr:hypothetical protein [Leptospiraceae bacterium]MDW8306232.1 ABC transporter substrate binding protein [Leptospiraceae bacterium]